MPNCCTGTDFEKSPIFYVSRRNISIFCGSLSCISSAKIKKRRLFKICSCRPTGTGHLPYNFIRSGCCKCNSLLALGQYGIFFSGLNVHQWHISAEKGPSVTHSAYLGNSYRDWHSLFQKFLNFFSNNIIVLIFKRPKKCQIFWNSH